MGRRVGNSCLGGSKSEYEKEMHAGWPGTTECPFEITRHEIYETSQYSGVFVQQHLISLWLLLIIILAGIY